MKGGDCIKRILVIDDDVTLWHQFEDDLQSESIELVFADSSAVAFHAFLSQEFSFIMLDAKFSEADSHRLLSAMQKAKPVPVLILSIKSGFHRAIKFFLEHDTFEEYAYTLVRCKYLVIDPVRREASLKYKKLKLTRKEFDLLYYLAANPGRVLTREQLYSHVWDEDNAYDVDSIVKTHISALRKKLATANVEYIRNIWGVGYIFDSEKCGD